MRYKYNPYCSCSRCRMHGYMGPAVLITLGVLFLLSQASGARIFSFEHTWPALLIVIGLVLFLQHSASADGHVPRNYVAPQFPPGYQPVMQQPGTMPPVVTPAPAQPSGSLPPAAPYNQGQQNDTGVHNG